MRPVYRRQVYTPTVSFEFQNRQLMWNAFTVRPWPRWRRTRPPAARGPVALLGRIGARGLGAEVWLGGPQEFLLFAMPLVNVHGWRARLGRWLRQVTAQPAEPSASGSGPSGHGVGEGAIACGICGTSPIVVPYRVVPCQHRFCYVCLYGAVADDDPPLCPTCGTAATQLERGDAQPLTEARPSEDAQRV